MSQRYTLSNIVTRTSALHSAQVALVVAIILAGGLAVGALRGEGQQEVAARDSGLTMRLVMCAKDGAITTGEPLIAEIDLTNASDRIVNVSLGNSLGPGTYLEIRNDNGEVLASTPRPDPRGQGVQGLRKLEPGEVYRQYWVLSALYRFERPGLYTIYVSQVRISDGLPVLAEDTVQLRVLPANRAKLEARCDEIYRGMRGPGNGQRLPLSACTKALYSVKDEVALPYLERLATEWESKYACPAIRRIGTKRAMDVLSKLSKRKDSAGKSARQTLEGSQKEPDLMWRMNYY